jgi:hypothetical protein
MNNNTVYITALEPTKNEQSLIISERQEKEKHNQNTGNETMEIPAHVVHHLRYISKMSLNGL